MNKFSSVLIAAALSALTWTAQAASPDEAKALLDDAANEVKTAGLDTAVKHFNAGGKWNAAGMYVVLTQFDGLTLAHSAYDKMPGKNMLEAKDAAGKTFLKEAISAAQSSGSGQVAMRWPHPQTKQITDATFFFKRLPGKDLLVGTVIFK